MVRIADLPDMTTAVYCGYQANRLAKWNLYVRIWESRQIFQNSRTCEVCCHLIGLAGVVQIVM